MNRRAKETNLYFFMHIYSHYIRYYVVIKERSIILHFNGIFKIDQDYWIMDHTINLNDNNNLILLAKFSCLYLWYFSYLSYFYITRILSMHIGESASRRSCFEYSIKINLPSRNYSIIAERADPRWKKTWRIRLWDSS